MKQTIDWTIALNVLTLKGKLPVPILVSSRVIAVYPGETARLPGSVMTSNYHVEKNMGKYGQI